MSDIPSEVCREILLRLPAESLLCFKRVCKAWRGMIEDPSFIKAHTENQVYPHTLLVRSITKFPTFSFSVDSLNAINGPQMIEATYIRTWGLPDLFEAASCNGLILLTYEDVHKKRNWVIWNPLTRDSHFLPTPIPPKNDLCGYGFGYDDDADDYKVVRVTQFEKNVNQTLIYSLRSDSWSAIEDSPGWLSHLNSGAFLNGTFYWVSESLDKIISLTVNTERYTQIPFPPLNIRSRALKNLSLESRALKNLSLEALDGFLILSFHNGGHFEGWVMKDEGWNKLFCMEFYEYSYKLKLVAYLKDKRRIVAYHDRGLLMFDVDNRNSMKKFTFHGFPTIDSSRICPGSLVRLHSSGSGGTSSTPTKKEESGGTSSTPTKMESKIREKLKFIVRDDKEDCGLEKCWKCNRYK